MMEQIVLAVAAILGSTGIAGLLSGGVQWSRAARLRHSVERMTGLIDKVGPDTAAGKALAAASQRDAVRLSVMSIIQLPGQAVRTFAATVLLLIAVAAITFVAFMRVSDKDSELIFRTPFDLVITGMIAPMGLGLMLIYVVALMWVMDARLRQKREGLAWAVLESESISQELIEKHDFHYSAFRRAAIEKDPTEPIAVGS